MVKYKYMNHKLPAFLTQLDATLQLYFGQKSPQLPDSAKELIVKYSPYLTIVGIILTASSLLTLLGFLQTYSFLGIYRPNFGLGQLILLATIVLEALALPGLFKRQFSGWLYLFYTALLSGLHSLVSLQLVSFIIGLAISFYVLYQIKSYYK